MNFAFPSYYQEVADLEEEQRSDVESEEESEEEVEVSVLC